MELEVAYLAEKSMPFIEREGSLPCLKNPSSATN
jgi:hypothetical protein